MNKSSKQKEAQNKFKKAIKLAKADKSEKPFSTKVKNAFKKL